MNPEDIKIGERVSLSGYIANKTDKHFFITIHTGFNEYTKIKVAIPSLELYEIMPENGTKNTESAPKYDPRRKFRKGDKVRFKEHLGRKSLAHCDEIITLEADEKYGNCFWREMAPDGDIIDRNAYFCYLELVTPVEELEPYFVMELKGAYGVYNTRFQPETEACHFYTDMHPHAKEAAEAECDRLNAEHRKENQQ